MPKIIHNCAKKHEWIEDVVKIDFVKALKKINLMENGSEFIKFAEKRSFLQNKVS